jgi:hypothetical protein
MVKKKKKQKAMVGPSRSQKKREHLPLFQVLLKPMLTRGREKTPGDSQLPIIDEWGGHS